ncbi:MAG TPA: TlpA disulfide reductase family protein [Ignavibacteria bacterium]
MKILKYLFFVALVIFVSACNKNNNSENKDSKDNKVIQQTNTNDAANKTADFKFYKISKSENSAKEKIAPEITWDENGKQIKLSDLKGNVVLVNFWATWCKPCVGEMPDLSLISQELKDKNFRIIGISTEEPKTIENFLKTKPVAYTILNGPEETVNVFEKAIGKTMDGIPATFILDKEGKIVEFFMGSKSKADFINIINKYLK